MDSPRGKYYEVRVEGESYDLVYIVTKDYVWWIIGISLFI